MMVIGICIIYFLPRMIFLKVYGEPMECMQCKRTFLKEERSLDLRQHHGS